MSNEFHEGWAETEREKKTGSTVAVLAWRDHVRGFKELDPSACARFTQRNYARRVNERYTVYNSRLPVGFAGKKEKRQRGAMSSDQKRHLSTRGAIIFPAFRNLEYQSILNLETVIYIILQLYYPRRKKEKKEYKKNASSLRLIVILKQLEHEWIDANGGKKERKKKNRNCTSINNKFRNNVGKRWIFSEEEGDDYGRKNSIVVSRRSRCANNQGS